MNCIGIAGLTTPWRTIYLHSLYRDEQWLIRHELAHIKQIERDGPWVWSLKIVWYFIRYGYRYSPYEIEARKAEHEPC